MPKAKKLTDIGITHISLVKAGANGKSIIYKSASDVPIYDRTIEIVKSDDEKGIIYGVVYAPEEVDSQGDYTTADEIEKAAYSFMKSKNQLNVDKDHDFENVDAFVCESWIVKENDPVFPDESAGTWAVAIKLESEELKKEAKEGNIAGISMAGTAQKVDGELEVEKAETSSIDMLVEAMKKVFGYVSLNLHGDVYNPKVEKEDKGEELNEEQVVEAVTKTVDPLLKKIGNMEKEIAELKKSDAETKEELKKSKQDGTPPPADVKKSDDGIEGIL